MQQGYKTFADCPPSHVIPAGHKRDTAAGNDPGSLLYAWMGSCSIGYPAGVPSVEESIKWKRQRAAKFFRLLDCFTLPHFDLKIRHENFSSSDSPMSRSQIIRVQPPARLLPREGDEILSVAQLRAMKLFTALRRVPDLERYPGYLVLRRYRKGAKIVIQGEPGWTAFYILTTEELIELRLNQLEEAKHNSAPDKKLIHQLESQLQEASQRMKGLATLEDDSLERAAASVQLEKSGIKPPGLVKKALSWIFIDGPSVLPANQLTELMYEGEIFGEMSCLYRTPRSATVVATRDCYMLEMIRNIYDRMNRGEFRNRMNAVYKRRVLGFHLRNHPLFQGFEEAEFETVKDNILNQAELETRKPGEIICDEFEPADCMYLIRSGFVRVMKNTSRLLRPKDIFHYRRLCTQVVGASDDSAMGEIAKRVMTSSIAETIREIAAGTLAVPGNEPAIVKAFNEVIMDPTLMVAPAFSEWAADLDSKSLAVSDCSPQQQVRMKNRALLELVFPGLIASAEMQAPCVVAYRSRGDFIGEMAIVPQSEDSRSATCVAYDHPNSKFGSVELVRIDKSLFSSLYQEDQKFAQHVDQVIRSRLEETTRTTASPLVANTRQLDRSHRYETLGLRQGQSLMLIDLDLCTRCNECVQACVETHSPSKFGPSRIQLDGPRIGKYLVPNTCRQCKDPVCLIGCPVGSIHLGASGEVVIEDWCIGCSLCAEQCPYEAIGMQEIGLLPRQSGAWRVIPEKDLPKNATWHHRSDSDKGWSQGKAPFYFDLEFRVQVGCFEKAAAGPLCFRREFDVPRDVLAENGKLSLQIETASSDVQAWLNGVPLTLQIGSKSKRFQSGAKQYQTTIRCAKPNTKSMAPKTDIVEVLRKRNVLAIRVSPPEKSIAVMLDAGVYFLNTNSTGMLPLEETSEVVSELVVQQAVVCDQCASLSSGQPACVNACPQDAAWRGPVDAVDSPLMQGY